MDTGRMGSSLPFVARFTEPPKARPSLRGSVRCRLAGYEPVLAYYYKRSGADGMDNRRL
ncbi:MAG: hypothetical protein QG582_1208 [Candidatus Thermoplasmatota archaeon]|nr:hypothetical protein [Candidatus Thermoplasmatota archaeon]